MAPSKMYDRIVRGGLAVLLLAACWPATAAAQIAKVQTLAQCQGSWKDNGDKARANLATAQASVKRLQDSITANHCPTKLDSKGPLPSIQCTMLNGQLGMAEVAVTSSTSMAQLSDAEFQLCPSIIAMEQQQQLQDQQAQQRRCADMQNLRDELKRMEALLISLVVTMPEAAPQLLDDREKIREVEAKLKAQCSG